MCTTKEHPFFKAIIEKTCENITNGYYGENSLDITGPMMIGKVFNCYFGNKCNFVNENNLVYGTNDYSCDRCKIKMLKFVGKPYLFRDTYFIEDQNKTLIQTKFDDYFYNFTNLINNDFKILITYLNIQLCISYLNYF